jgi:precorrin-2 methylase
MATNTGARRMRQITRARRRASMNREAQKRSLQKVYRRHRVNRIIDDVIKGMFSAVVVWGDALNSRDGL